IRVLVEEAGDKVPIIAGLGGNSTRKIAAMAQEVQALGVQGILSVSPYYNKPTQEGLYQHFKAIAESTALPVILYNVPSRSPRNLEAATTIRLAEVRNIVAVKEASGKLEQIAEIIAHTPPEFRVYSGDDSATLPLMSLGAYGVISVAAHAAGRLIRRMIDAFAEGRPAEAAELN